MFIITGGGSGLGKAIALALAKRSKKVLIVGRRRHLLQETASLAVGIDYFCSDLSTMQGLDALINHCHSLTKIDALVNNAGVLEPMSLLQDMDPNEWNHALQTNLNAPLFLTQKLYGSLINSRVLNIGTGAAYFPIKGWSAYCVSKAALSMLTRCWQLEADSVLFASVMPGIIDTHMQEIARSDLNCDSKQVDFYRQLQQQNRLLSAETVAIFLTWLLLDVPAAKYVSREWDIYDTSHHQDWLVAPHQVPDMNI